MNDPYNLGMQRISRRFARWLPLTVLCLLLAPAQAHGQEAPQVSLMDVLRGMSQFRMFASAVEAAGMSDTLSGDGPFTVLVPSNEAFEKLGERRLRSYFDEAHVDRLKALVNAHILRGTLPVEQIVSAESVRTLEGGGHSVSLSGGAVSVGGAKLIAVNLQTRNGLIHIVDTVIQPRD